MKQRYHYNVSTQRLLVHVQKGWEDGLFVTCVASCDDLWAIVMDAGTEYTQQIYKVWGKFGGKRGLMVWGCIQGGMRAGHLDKWLSGSHFALPMSAHLLYLAGPPQLVPAQGVDHGEVGGGLLHHVCRGLGLQQQPGGDEQGGALQPAVVQGEGEGSRLG